MRLFFPFLVFPVLVGCGEIELEGPDERLPSPRCRVGELFDPETGRCVHPPCLFDEDCAEGERCDRIEGICS